MKRLLNGGAADGRASCSPAEPSAARRKSRRKRTRRASSGGAATATASVQDKSAADEMQSGTQKKAGKQVKFPENIGKTVLKKDNDS